MFKRDEVHLEDRFAVMYMDFYLKVRKTSFKDLPLTNL